MTGVPGGLAARVREGVRDLAPGYFALVMGSGIISIGLARTGHRTLSWSLLTVCATAFGVLVLLTLWRLVAHRDAVVEDFADPRRAFGFFTFIAGANVLGVRLAMAGRHSSTAALLVVSGLTWLVLGYVIPWTAVLGRERHPVLASANGTWFIWVVGSQSVAVAAAVLEPVYVSARQVLAVVAVSSWSVGVCLYLAAGIFVAARVLVYDFGPVDLTPPYWVAMGASAITVVAGATIVGMTDAPMIVATRGLIAGAAVVFWAFATWLIPVLAAAGWWRHRRHRVPLRYEPALWSIVFPLGMYAVACLTLGDADSLPLVEGIGRAELWIAVAAWVLTFAAMTWHVVGTVVLARERSAVGSPR